ncbi:MAG: hypothetical protein K8S94_14740 [Planctomycetia bacterium]|nr:hypothetical protein [Planctomycetia bacterium]
MLSPEQVVDTYFLEARHMLLEIAALLDRYDAAAARCEGDPANGRATAGAAKLATLREALGILREQAPTRERTVALLELFARV